jgi:hypothetical protein
LTVCCIDFDLFLFLDLLLVLLLLLARLILFLFLLCVRMDHLVKKPLHSPVLSDAPFFHTASTAGQSLFIFRSNPDRRCSFSP